MCRQVGAGRAGVRGRRDLGRVVLHGAARRAAPLVPLVLGQPDVLGLRLVPALPAVVRSHTHDSHLRPARTRSDAYPLPRGPVETRSSAATVYLVGRTSGTSELTRSVIWPTFPVASKVAGSPSYDELHTWARRDHRYTSMSIAARRDYLRWLANGRSDFVRPALALLWMNGVARRILADDACTTVERSELLKHVDDLSSRYLIHDQVPATAEALHAAAAAVWPPPRSYERPPPVVGTVSRREFALLVGAAVGQSANDGAPLDDGWALAWLQWWAQRPQSSLDPRLTGVLHDEERHRRFRRRFRVRYPSGFRVEPVAEPRVIIAGDFRQLGPIVVTEDSTARPRLRTDAFAASGITRLHAELMPPHAAVLQTQYRMPEAVCDVINRTFYPDHPLRTARLDRRNRHAADRPAITYVDTGGLKPQAASRFGQWSLFNLLHLGVVHNLMLELWQENEVAHLRAIAPYQEAPDRGCRLRHTPQRDATSGQDPFRPRCVAGSRRCPAGQQGPSAVGRSSECRHERSTLLPTRIQRGHSA